MFNINKDKLGNIKIVKLQKILIFIALNIIAVNFILITDDYVFANLNLDTMWRFIFNNTGTESWNIKNGRYLGNILGVLLCMTYKFKYLEYIRGVFMGSGMFVLILLCSKFSGLNKSIRFIVSTLLILSAPIKVYTQVYSWTPAYVNYLIPTIIFLIILLILDNCIKSKRIQNKSIFLIFLLGVSCQLFMENITIYVFLFSLIVVIYFYCKDRKLLKISVPLFLSTLIGMIVMFSCKGYQEINSDGYRYIGLSNLLSTVINNILIIFKITILDNFILISIILLLCFFIIKHSKYKYKILGVAIFSSILYIISIKYVFGIIGMEIDKLPKIIRIVKYLLDCINTFNIMGILLYTTFKFIKDKNLKEKICFYYSSIIVISLPLVIVNPISTRCVFICYVFLTIICMNLGGYVLNYYNIKKINRLNIIANILVIVILINKFYIFNNINREFREIICYTQEQIISKNTDIILIPKFTYQKYIHADIATFIGFLYYRNTPNDIKFKTIDRDKWEQIANNK